MSLEDRVKVALDQVGDDMQSVMVKVGDTASLNTVAKTLAEAINELLAATPAGTLLAASNLSDLIDVVAARQNLDVSSTAQITAEIASALASITLGSLGGLDQAAVDARVQEVVGTAPAALDTLNEIAAALGNDADFANTIALSLSNKLDFTVAQVRTTAEKLQACNNLGVGDPEADFLATYVAARDA